MDCKNSRPDLLRILWGPCDLNRCEIMAEKKTRNTASIIARNKRRWI
jgi:hypothetical protein